MSLNKVFVIGRDTRNKLKLAQMLGGKEDGDGNSEITLDSEKYIIKYVFKDEVDNLNREENNEHDYFFYVYDVDDKETFNMYVHVQTSIKWRFKRDDSKPYFILYGINCNIKHKRSVSHEELMNLATKNKSNYFELQKFNLEGISQQLRKFKPIKLNTIYITGSEESGYKHAIENKFKQYELLVDSYILMNIEEMKSPEEIDIDTSKIKLCYSPFKKESFTAIEEYISKYSNSQRLFEISLSIIENIDPSETRKEKEITSYEAKKYCLMKGIGFEAEKEYDYLSQEGYFDRFGIPSRKFEDKLYVNSDLKDKYQQVKSKLAKSGIFKLIRNNTFNDIFFFDLFDGIKDRLPKNFNYIIAGNSNNLTDREAEIIEKDIIKPIRRQHYIRVDGSNIETVIEQYFELQKPAKETIHIFCNENIKYALLFRQIIGFVNEEECKFISFHNHIYKYRIEFHNKLTFNEEEMKYMIIFSEIDNESEIETLYNDLTNIGIFESKTKFMIPLLTPIAYTNEEEENRIGQLKNKYLEISNMIESVQIPEDIVSLLKTTIMYHTEKKFVKRMDKVFTRLIEGNKELGKQTEEGTCCRI